MQKNFSIRHLLYIALLACILLGSSQVGMASAEQDDWFTEEAMGSPLAVNPVTGLIPIATSALRERSPTIAYGGNHYMVVYISAGEIHASVRNNTGHFVRTIIVDNEHNNFDSPKIAYHAPSDLFLVTYNRPSASEVRLNTVSPTGAVGMYYIYFNAVSSDIACKQNSISCLLAYHTSIGGLDYLSGRYLTLGPNGIISQSGTKSLSNLSGRSPKLAWGKDTGTYLLAFTRKPPAANDDILYTHVYDAEPEGEIAYTHSAKQIITEPNILTNDKEVKSIAYDPCTQHYIVLFDHQYSLHFRDVWMAAIHKTNDQRSWLGTVANNNQQEFGGGISFVTNDHQFATCGQMNKLVATYANMSDFAIYAVEIRGNNNPVAPAYQVDPVDQHFKVYQVNEFRPNWWPVITAGPGNSELFIALDTMFISDINDGNVYGRIVHVWEPEEVPFSKLYPADGTLDLPLNLPLSWEKIDNIDSYEYCLGTIKDNCNIKGWTSTGTKTGVLFNGDPNTTYFWQVRVINTDGTFYANDREWWSFTTGITGGPVIADFIGTPTNGTVPLTVAFTNMSTGDYDTCTWEFGDGATSTSCENLSHTYQSAGVYTVKLIVTGGGLTGTRTRPDYISVVSDDKPVKADFTASPTSGAAPLTVAFTNQSTGDYNTCAWDFGDGAVSDNCNNPSHTYQTDGAYSVKLTVSGGGGTSSLMKINFITVGDIGHRILLPLIQN